MLGLRNFQGIVFIWTQTYRDFQFCVTVPLMKIVLFISHYIYKILPEISCAQIFEKHFKLMKVNVGNFYLNASAAKLKYWQMMRNEIAISLEITIF